MIEGDDEDLWMLCLNAALDVEDGRYPSYYLKTATQFFDEAKRCAAKHKAEAKPRPVLQLKS